jgi:hypothetical protein
MRPFLVRLLSILVLFSLFAPIAYAQAPPSATAQEGPGAPAFQFTVAFLSFLLLMVMVCAPSRKS